MNTCRTELRDLCDPRVYMDSLRREAFRREQRQKNLGLAIVLVLVIGSFVAALLS